MADLRQFINQLTDKLRDDAELRMDVAEELAGHVEEAAAECRAAGMDDQQAMDHAMKVMGDPQELSEQLFQANRRRMKFRAVARWAAGAALLPAAIATIVLLAAVSGMGVASPEGAAKRLASRLPEDKQLLLAAATANTSERAAALKAVCDRWPGDPVYYACYINAALRSDAFRTQSDHALRPDKLSEALELLDKGERLEPSNAYYNMRKAAFIFAASCTISEDESRTYDLSFPTWNKDGKAHPYKIKITNPALFQQGVKEFRLATSKPTFTDHELDMLERQLAPLPPSKNLNDILSRWSLKAGMSLPALSDYRQCLRTTDAYALSLAGQDSTQSLDILRDARQMNIRLGAQANTLIEMLVANVVQMNTLATQRLVHLEMNQPKLADNDTVAIRQLADLTSSIRRQYPSTDDVAFNKHSGTFWSMLTPTIVDYHTNVEPLRTVEAIKLAQASLMILLIVLVLLTLPVMLVNMIALLRHRRGLMLFVGWRRIGRICLWAIVVPLMAYGAYYAWQVYNPDAFGLNYTIGRVLLELATVLLVILFLLLRMSYQAIRERCVELGLSVPAGRRWPALVGMGLLVAITSVYVVCWWAHPPASASTSFWNLFPWFETLLGGSDGSRSQSEFVGASLAVIVLAIAVIWVLASFVCMLLSTRRNRDFGRAFFRSLVPILCSAVIVVGVLCGGLLAYAETSAARRVGGEADFDIKREVDRSAYRHLRAYFVEQLKTMGTGNGTANSKSRIEPQKQR